MMMMMFMFRVVGLFGATVTAVALSLTAHY